MHFQLNPKYNVEELEINKKMHNFGMRLATYLESQNTLSAQLRIRGKRANQRKIFFFLSGEFTSPTDLTKINTAV